MTLNVGFIELGGGGVTARIYYDTAWLNNNPAANPGDAPLVNGPRGFCMDLTNTTGANIQLIVYGVSGDPAQAQHVTIGQGDPVTTGPTGGRSRTVAQMAALGFTTRGNVGTVSLGE